jgi:fimbrial chaperone protein
MAAAKISSRLFRRLAFLGLTVCAALGISVASAATLRIEPVLVDVPPPGSAATLTLRNDDPGEITVQLRVFRWSQANGKETLEPTTDVVASPPAVKLAPGKDYVARVVRTTKRVLQGEESYRIFVDQLPQNQGAPAGQINLLIRQSIPVFFGRTPEARAQVTWSLAYDGPSLVLTARNAGARRLRVSAVTLSDDAGKTVSFGEGLVGYVLSRSTMNWKSEAVDAGVFAANGSVVLNGQGDTGPIHVVIPAPARR